jgi:hypothetical protein
MAASLSDLIRSRGVRTGGRNKREIKDKLFVVLKTGAGVREG